MDGNESTAELIEELPQQSQSVSNNPEEIAATMFTLYLPRFQAAVDRLSNKALRRVLKALIEYPLVDEEYQFSSELEKDTFFVAERLILAKMMMIQHTLMNNTEFLQSAEQTDSLETETKVENETNG